MPHALSEALNAIDQVLDLKAIVAFTSTGHSAVLAASERPKAAVIAVTSSDRGYHRLKLHTF